MKFLDYIKAAAVAVFFALVVAVKVLMGRNKELKREVKVGKKRVQIQEDQAAAKIEVIQDEPAKVNETVESNNGKGRADRINSVLDSDHNP